MQLEQLYIRIMCVYNILFYGDEVENRSLRKKVNTTSMYRSNLISAHVLLLFVWCVFGCENKIFFSQPRHATYESLTIKCFWCAQQKEGAVVVFLLAAKDDGLKGIDKRQWPGKNHQSPLILAMDLVDPNAWQLIGTEKCIFRQTNADTVTLTLVGAST